MVISNLTSNRDQTLTGLEVFNSRLAWDRHERTRTRLEIRTVTKSRMVTGEHNQQAQLLVEEEAKSKREESVCMTCLRYQG
jgi:hypothetical protein